MGYQRRLNATARWGHHLDRKQNWRNIIFVEVWRNWIVIAACCWFITEHPCVSKLTLKWTGNFPLALIGPNIFGNQQNILMAYLHNIYSGILYKVISIFGHDLNVLDLAFLLSGSTFLWRKQKNFAAFPLACEQALCLGKGEKIARRGKGKGFFFTLSPNREPVHTLRFCHKPVKNVPQDWIHHDCQHFSVAHV